MPISDASRTIAWTVLNWLKHVKASELKDQEELDVAIDCINATFELSNAEECKAKFDKGISLPLLIHAEVEKRGVALARSVDVDNDQRFKEFIAILSQKNYFADCEPGSAAYNEKMEKAKAKFAQRNNPFEGLNAEQLKAKGNQLMSQNNCGEAINYYNKAIELDPSNAVFYSNRAAAHIHLKMYKKAIEDCRKSVVLDANYSKAHSRLGTSLFYDGQYKEAVDAYEVALRLEPTNEGYINDLKAAKDKLSESVAPSLGGDAFSFLQNKNFMKMAVDMMAKPEFNTMIQGFAKQMSEGDMNLADIFKNNPFAAGPNGMMQSPFGDIPRDEVEALQNSPEYKDNPRIQAVLEEAKRDGPSALFKYMNDKEVMDALTGLATKVMTKIGGQVSSSSSSSSAAPLLADGSE